MSKSYLFLLAVLPTLAAAQPAAIDHLSFSKLFHLVHETTCQDTAKDRSEDARLMGRIFSLSIKTTDPYSREREAAIKQASDMLDKYINKFDDQVEKALKSGRSGQRNFDKAWSLSHKVAIMAFQQSILVNFDKSSRTYERLLRDECLALGAEVSNNVALSANESASIKPEKEASNAVSIEKSSSASSIRQLAPSSNPNVTLIIPQPINLNGCIQDGGPIFCPKGR